MKNMADHSCFDSPARNALPNHLFDTYVRYKQGTRAIVAWLLSQRTWNHGNPGKISIGYLWDLAKIVRNKAKPLPDTIAFHFRETISARKRLTQFFRDKPGDSISDRSTADHQFFTTSLSEIYALLCDCNIPCHRQPDAAKHGCRRSSNPISNNAFDVLKVDQSTEYGADKHTVEQCDACDETGTKTALKSHDTVDIVDDHLGETLELMKIFKDIRDVCDTVNRSWDQAARQEIPIVLAAFVTNVCFTYLKGYESQVQLWWDIKDPATLHDRAQGMKILPTGERSKRQGASAFELGIADEHRDIWDVLLGLKEAAPLRTSRLKVPNYQIASSYIVPDRRVSPEGVVMLLCCIADLAASGTSNSVVQFGTPVFSDVVKCLGEDTEKSCLLPCTTGIMMLYEGFQSFLWPEGVTDMTKANPRVQALRFAEEVRGSISAVLEDQSMPCRCCYTLAANLEAFQLDVEAYLKEKKFNLYFQAPWVCGGHILEMLETSFSYGMRLCSYRHYLGSVLHLYNLLVTTGHILQVQFLETLCDVFGDTIFPGGRPKSKFSACFLRFKGGRLKQTRKHRKEWHLAIPKHSAREAAGFGLPGEPVHSRFQAKKLSLMHYIKGKKYALDEEDWEKVNKSRTSGSKDLNSLEDASKQAEERKDRRRDSGCLIHEQTQDRFLEMQGVLAASEFVASPANPLPIVRINFFKVYLAAVRAVSSISDSHHEDQPSGRHCLCFIDELLRRGDEISEDRAANRQTPFGYKGLINLCEDSIVKAFDVQGRDFDQYMWTNL